MYFCAFRSISAIVLGGFFVSETTNSLNFNRLKGCQLHFVISFVYLQGLSSKAFHIRPQGLLLPLPNGEQVVRLPLRVLPSDEVA